ncbi:MAG: epoxyqueuosine reductase [Ruminococcaceae bacterium]|nr:epoxyqueuosine reductase [Oscillospiraceae bacterium]
MIQRIAEILRAEGIELFSPISLSFCNIKKDYLLRTEGIKNGTAIMLAAPYLSREAIGAGISAYAVPRDYHLYFRELFARILPVLREEFPENRFCGFTDHSPIDERDAAAKSGLGIIGKNGLLITEKYSSFVFIGEIITDADLPCSLSESKYCEDCGACTAACPMREGFECLSAVTQKKGELSSAEADYIRKYGSLWGCDICQNACPHTKRAIDSGEIFTKIPFFLEKLTPRPTADDILSMNDVEFSERAYSWRGRECILRNIGLSEK